MNSEGILEEQTQQEKTPPIVAMDFMSGIQTNIFRPDQTLNPEVTLTNLSGILAEIEAAEYTTGLHIQAGFINPPARILNIANGMNIKVLAGDLPYLLNPKQFIETSFATPNALLSMAYLGMNAVPTWGVQERVMTTFVTGIPAIDDKVLLRAPTQAIKFNQLDRMVELIKKLKNKAVIAFEMDSAYPNVKDFYEAITQMARDGLPVGISFDSANMSVVYDENTKTSSLSQAAARREYERVLQDKTLASLLWCFEIDPLYPDGQKHGLLEHLGDTVTGAITAWQRSKYAIHPPHFVFETDPRHLPDIMRDKEPLRKVLRDLKS